MSNSMMSEIQRIQSTLDKLIINFNSIEKEFNNVNNATKILKLSKLYKINTRKNILVQVINLALKDIFFDKELKIDIETNETSNTALGYNVQYDFIIYKNGNELARNTDIYDSNGGGAISIISWVLKLLMSYLNNTGNFLAFDESFSQVSEKYLNSLSMFIRNICEKYDLYIILITHQNISEHAHLTYNFSGTLDSKGIDELVTDRIDIRIDGINNIDEVVDCYQLKASNFQSIVNLDLKIKGFTCILGDSDIGKTATIRAINSIINNDFNVNYKRIKTRGSVDIYFGYVNSDNDYNKIHLSYKNSSVYYYLEDGTELKGKSLAAERISDALSEFGFKQIDISAYKNWNSELKKQTQRLNVTTQHDKLYFSNERNATEKILTLLFNSQGFNIGISAGINKSRELLNQMDYINSEIDHNTKIKRELEIALATNKLEQIDKILEIQYINLSKRKSLNSLTHSIIYLEPHISDIDEKLKNYHAINRLMGWLILKFNLTVKHNECLAILDKLETDVQDMIDCIRLFNQATNMSIIFDKAVELQEEFDNIVKVNLSEEDINRLAVLNIKFKIALELWNRSKTAKSYSADKDIAHSKVVKVAKSGNSAIRLRNKYYMSIKVLNLINSSTKDKVKFIDVGKKIHELDELITNYTLIKSEFITTHKVLQYFEKSTSIVSELQDNEAGMDHIHSKYQLQECPHCLGVGLIPISK